MRMTALVVTGAFLALGGKSYQGRGEMLGPPVRNASAKLAKHGQATRADDGSR